MLVTPLDEESKSGALPLMPPRREVALVIIEVLDGKNWSKVNTEVWRLELGSSSAQWIHRHQIASLTTAGSDARMSGYPVVMLFWSQPICPAEAWWIAAKSQPESKEKTYGFAFSSMIWTIFSSTGSMDFPSYTRCRIVSPGVRPTTPLSSGTSALFIASVANVAPYRR